MDCFPNLPLSELPEDNQATEVLEAVENMLAGAPSQGFRQERFDDAIKIVIGILGVFHTTFSKSAAEQDP